MRKERKPRKTETKKTSKSKKDERNRKKHKPEKRETSKERNTSQQRKKPAEGRERKARGVEGRRSEEQRLYDVVKGDRDSILSSLWYAESEREKERDSVGVLRDLSDLRVVSG